MSESDVPILINSKEYKNELVKLNTENKLLKKKLSALETKISEYKKEISELKSKQKVSSGIYMEKYA